jgi:hypothetical protein
LQRTIWRGREEREPSNVLPTLLEISINFQQSDEEWLQAQKNFEKILA